MKNLFETLKSLESFKMFVEELEQTDIADELRSKGPFTLFVPYPKAIKDLSRTYEYEIENSEHFLKDILLNHIIPGIFLSSDLKFHKTIDTLEGNAVFVHDGGGKIENAHILDPDIIAENGVIHIIDHILIPKKMLLIM